MVNVDDKEKMVLQKPSSRATSVLKIVLNICFYVASLMWIVYSTFLFIEYIPESWILYWSFHSTLVGFITYKALIIDLRLADRNFFKKNHLVPIFVSFAVTAPLASIPSVVSGISLGGGEWSSLLHIPITLVWGGQLYWLLLPVQVAITVWGKSCFLLNLGYVIFFASVLNIVTTCIVLAFLAFVLSF